MQTYDALPAGAGKPQAMHHVKHEAFGSDVPLAEPSWYQNLNTPFYNASHVAWRAKLRDFFEKEVEPSESSFTGGEWRHCSKQDQRARRGPGMKRDGKTPSVVSDRLLSLHPTSTAGRSLHALTCCRILGQRGRCACDVSLFAWDFSREKSTFSPRASEGLDFYAAPFPEGGGLTTTARSYTPVLSPTRSRGRLG